MVLSSSPMSSSFLITTPMLSSICFMPASLAPQSLPPLVPIMSRYFCDRTVVMCMRAGLYQTKNGLLVFLGSFRSRKSTTWEEISSSTVFERSSVSGPSSFPVWFLAVPSENITQMVFAELAGAVALIEQELGERRGARSQIRNGARQLWQDHARAVRMHSGEEGGAPGRAARLGVVVHEHAAFVRDPVNVRCFTDHQAAVIAARLHPADVVTHDEQDIRFLF